MYTAREIEVDDQDDEFANGWEILDPSGDVIAIVGQAYVEGLLSHLNR